jgi:predicted nuclease of predicted toxin-antitoxin system
VPARLKVDENLPAGIADLLNQRGHDAVTVVAQGWRGLADNELWLRIQAEGRWLITADKEFADLRRYPPGSHCGVVLLRSAQEGLDEYLRLARNALAGAKLDQLAGAVIVVTPQGLRIRPAPDC